MLKKASFLTWYLKLKDELIVKCINKWKNALDKDKYVNALFMDLSKAFGCLPHRLIIAKLHANGSQVPDCKLLIFYLRGRKQMLRSQIVEVHWQS